MSSVIDLNKSLIKSSFSAASDSYDSAARLQREVGLDLLMNFSQSAVSGSILDVGCGTGFITNELVSQPGIDRIFSMDIAMPMLQKSIGKTGAYENIMYFCADAEGLPILPSSVDGIVSNLALQWCSDLQAIFDDFHRILKPGGRLAFTTFGPETLKELKQAWTVVDAFRHVNDFFSSDVLFECLSLAGFSNIVVDLKRYHPSYFSVLELMKELKFLGAHNVSYSRNRGITTRKRLQTMMEAYPLYEDRVHATYDVISIFALKSE